MSRSLKLALCAISCALSLPTAQASDVTGLTTFTSGTPARANEVNDNFGAVKSAVDDNHARIAALEATIAQLAARLGALENSQVMALNPYIDVQSANGPTVVLTGANLQIVNGMERSASTNGLGNLILGYNEARTSGTEVCSIGADANDVPLFDEATCSAAGGVWALNHKSGSHYLVVGPENNFSRWSGIVVGWSNTANHSYAAVSGGAQNTASGFASSISGGVQNAATNSYASVVGGTANEARGSFATVSGGNSNIASGNGSTVSGGRQNEASGTFSSATGGQRNTATGDYSVVSGGNARSSNGEHDWVAGSLLEDL